MKFQTQITSQDGDVISTKTHLRNSSTVVKQHKDKATWTNVFSQAIVTWNKNVKVIQLKAWHQTCNFCRQTADTENSGAAALNFNSVAYN